MGIPKFQHPSHALLEENGFKQMKYVKFYKRCIDDRAQKGACVWHGWGGEGASRLGSVLGRGG